MDTLDRNGLFAALDRFGSVPSLLAPDRVCLGISQANRPELRAGDGFIFHWTGNSLPWFLWPLGLFVSSGQYVVELTRPGNVTSFAHAADNGFTVTYCSFSRERLQSVLSGLRSGLDEAIGLAHEDPTYAELAFSLQDDDDRVLVLTRANRECPPDLAKFFDDIWDLEEADGP